MKRLTRTLPLLLAAALQLLPLLRNIVTSPAASSSFAIILRWGIGAGAALGAFDACSAASGTYMNTSSNITGTVGTAMSVTNNFVINGGNTATTSDGFILTSAGGTITSSFLTNSQTTTITLPSGLTFKCVSLNNAANIYGVISGTPTATAKTNISISAIYPGGYTYTTNLLITISAAAALPPTITSQPASVTNIVGNTVTLSVTNGGTAPFNYQWYFNTNTALLNATNASLTLASIQFTNTGTYSVAITNSAGATNSSFALLTVLLPPVLTNNPVGGTNVAGGGASLSVAAGGSAPLKYQWYFNTNTALPSATNSSLNLSSLHASQAGKYSVVITNTAGAVTSAVASLVITNPASPALTAPVKNTGGFQFTFVPAIGLTNSVETNSVVAGGTWGTLTNVPPPATASPVTVTDSFGGANRFYRVVIQP